MCIVVSMSFLCLISGTCQKQNTKASFSFCGSSPTNGLSDLLWPKSGNHADMVYDLSQAI